MLLLQPETHKLNLSSLFHHPDLLLSPSKRQRDVDVGMRNGAGLRGEQTSGARGYCFIHSSTQYSFLYPSVLWCIHFEKVISNLNYPLSSDGCLHQRENRLRVILKSWGRGMFPWRPWWRPWSRWRTPKLLRAACYPRTAVVPPVCHKTNGCRDVRMRV